MIEVAYTLNDGKERIGALVQDNAKTMVIFPYRWIRCQPIKVHKVKNQARILKSLSDVGKTFHFHLDVRGALANWSGDLLIGMFRHEDGTEYTAEEARAHLQKCLKAGIEALPFGEPCEGFDYKTGCPGHLS